MCSGRFSPDCLLIIVCSAPKVNRFAQILRNCLFAGRHCSAMSLCIFSCSPSASASLLFCLCAAVARCRSLCVIFLRSLFCLSASLFCCLSAVLLGSIAVCVFSCSPFCFRVSRLLLPARCRCSVLFSASVFQTSLCDSLPLPSVCRSCTSPSVYDFSCSLFYLCVPLLFAVCPRRCSALFFVSVFCVRCSTSVSLFFAVCRRSHFFLPALRARSSMP